MNEPNMPKPTNSAVTLGVSTSRRRTRGDGRSTVGEIDVNDDFERLGDAIRALELDVTLSDAGRAEYDRALAAYERANDLQRKGDEAGANCALDEVCEVRRRRRRLSAFTPLHDCSGNPSRPRLFRRFR